MSAPETISGVGNRTWANANVATDTSTNDAIQSRITLLDRLGRNLRHLVTLLEDLQAVGVAFVSLNEGIDCTTPAGKLQLHILAALAD